MRAKNACPLPRKTLQARLQAGSVQIPWIMELLSAF